jgi:protoheme IX farnesyltransferase
MSELSTAPGTISAEVSRAPVCSSLVGRFLTLTKARLSLLVLWTTAVGYVLATDAATGFGAGRFLWTLLGTALAAGCANTLNQVIEARRDERMLRTRGRPLPAGEVSPAHAIIFALALGVAGLTILASLVNGLAAGLAFGTIVIYVALYTPLKVRSSLNTIVGAVCGAIPPMIGWAGAAGTLEPGAWMLGGLLFVWQLPHFLALAWLYREDYERGGFVMLPLLDRSGRFTCRIVIVTSLLLIPLALTATLLGLAGWIYTAGSAALGLWMCWMGLRLWRQRTDLRARHVFLASLVYLSCVLLLLVADRGPVGPGPTIHRLAATPATAPLSTLPIEY